MVDLIGKRVWHKKLGDGTVVGQDGKRITVEFASKSSLFVYPDAFESFLKVEDEHAAADIQKDIAEVAAAAAARRTEEAQKREEEQRKREEKRAKFNQAIRNTKIGYQTKKIRKEDMIYDVPPIKTLDELLDNCAILDEYVASRKDPEYSFALGLIKRGTCFVVLESDDVLRFYPSRFVGYQENSMSKHECNGSKDGRVTNPAISQILNSKGPEPDTKLDALYKEYCKALGFEPNDKGTFGVDHKFWVLKLLDDSSRS